MSAVPACPLGRSDLAGAPGTLTPPERAAS